jgi:hypothetical protein
MQKRTKRRILSNRISVFNFAAKFERQINHMSPPQKCIVLKYYGDLRCPSMR